MLLIFLSLDDDKTDLDKVNANNNIGYVMISLVGLLILVNLIATGREIICEIIKKIRKLR